jgi:hypothetical protein
LLDLARRTLDGYELAVRLHLQPFCGLRPIATITASDLDAWHAALSRRRSVIGQGAAGTACAPPRCARLPSRAG